MDSQQVFEQATGRAADALAAASDAVESIGDRARTAGRRIRTRSYDASSAIARGESRLRNTDASDVVEAVDAAVQRHRTTLTTAAVTLLAAWSVSRWLHRRRDSGA